MLRKREKMSERQISVDSVRRDVASIRSSIERNMVTVRDLNTRRDVAFVLDSVSYTPPSAPRPFSPTQGFGIEQIPPSELLFSSQREPVIKWLTYWVAVDLFDNWLKVKDPDNLEDDSLDKAIQDVLEQLDAKRQLTRLLLFERRYGTAVMLCAYTNTDGENWESPIYDTNKNLVGERELLQITPYPWSKVNVKDVDTDSTSLRYGWPLYYEINRGVANTQSTVNVSTSANIGSPKVHWSRCIHAATRIDEEVYLGESVIYAIYDDATGFRNSRWAQYETLTRYGSGFPHIHLPNASRKEIQGWISAGRFEDINARGFFVSGGIGDEAESIEFIGVQDVTLNPEPYNEMAAWNLSMASRIPQDILKGVSAGRITGSEVNERAYFKFINAEQSNVEHIVRELIDRIIETGQVKYSDGRRRDPTKDYIIEWNYPQLTPELSQAQINFLNERAQTERLEYMTINEVRAKADPQLPPLDDEEEGNMVLGISMHSKGGEFSEFASNPERRTEEKTTEDAEDAEDGLNNTILGEALKK
jgi:hypothetical protein